LGVLFCRISGGAGKLVKKEDSCREDSLVPDELREERNEL